MKKFWLMILVILTITSIFSEDLIQYPTIYSDGKKLAFTFNGDIYKYNIHTKEITRITNNVDYDYRPIWSPDGNKIGFTSNRNGNYEAYVIKSSGGHPKRLTFNSNFDGLYNWPEKNNLYIGSYRSFKGKRTYKINTKGEILKSIVDFEMFKAKKKNDKYLFFNDGIGTNRRKYTGSASRDILIFDESENKIVYAVKNKYMNTFPVWGEKPNIIYYISNKGGASNIWKKNLDSNEEKQVTTFNTKHVQWLYSSPNGKYLSFIVDFQPYIYDIENKKLSKIEIAIKNDFHFTNKKLKKIGFVGFSEAEISQKGNNILFAAEGDILLNDTDKKNDSELYAQNLTDSFCWEKNIVWSPNNQIFAYVSTRSGFFDIYIQDISGNHTKKLTDSKQIENMLSFSKYGKYLAYCEFPGIVKIHNMKDHSEETILKMPYLYDLNWGPDGQFLLVSCSDSNYNQDVYIISRDGHFKRNISLSSGDCFNPQWSNKKDEIYWIEHKFDNYSIKKLCIDKKNKKGISLKEDDAFVLEQNQKEILKLKNKKIKNFKLIENDKSLIVAVESDTLNGIIKYNIEEKKSETIVQNQKIDTLRINEKNKRVYYISGGSFFSIRYSGRDTENYSAPAFKHINKKTEINELYNQAWIYISEWFYDKNFHNGNLKEIKRYYKKYIKDIALKRDLYTILDEVFGKLNASHLSAWGKREKSHNSRYKTGYFGALLDNNLKVKEVLKLTEISKKIKSGDKLLAINGKKVNSLLEMDKRLVGKVDKKVRLLFDNSKEVEIKLKTRKHFYEKFSKLKDIKNKRLVKEKSDNNLAYIHLHKMDEGSLKKFKEEIASYGRNKKGLILDVRDNSGGYIAGDLLGILNREVYAYSKRRYSEKLTEHPTGYSWSKPVVVLINEHSFSNAEIFPLGFRNLNLGTIVGVPTAGGVIGTYNTKLMDGTNFRLPHVKWLTLDKKNMENMGVKPDIYIENHPQQKLKDKDQQLNKAIEILNKKLNKE